MLGVARSTSRDKLRRAREAGLSWPLPVDLTDAVLEARCLPIPEASAGRAGLERLVRELKRPSVNLIVLRQEYPAGHVHFSGDGCGRQGGRDRQQESRKHRRNGRSL